MALVFGSFIQLGIKVMFFVAIAAAGIFCGKKYRVYKDANKANNKTLE